MAAPQNKRAPLLTQAGELVKQYIEYDVNGRMEAVYTANRDAKDGQECTVVQYVYHDTWTNNVVKMKESLAAWDSDWDI